jgi:hypothetical protein
VSFDSVLLYSITSLELAVIAAALHKKIPRLLPVFFAYLIWTVVSDVAGNLVRGNSQIYSQFFRYEMPLDSLLQFGVLVELAWSVLRPMRNMLPRWTILVISLLILVAGAIMWPFTSFTVAHGTRPDFMVLLRLQQTFSALRIMFFLGLAALSQVLAIGWRDRELQVATGLGFYSVMSMGAALLNAHSTSSGQFHAIEDVVAFSYLCSLLYWVVSFMQKEAARQEFSPRMRSLLLTVAGAARANRLAIEDIRKDPRH